ncbi:hypothetical protein [Alterisphingorhabdus coralli]|uniref:DUF11 domain-containing protein n=1 Tax=Alterisphingorhabdus coralli TaxID=3071408 RepID=A0AA97I1Y6_9SPHN|nr:hypothetical protein [Parasphingorhabdus sp. SCSIO 66989]WOE75768.1 hypothetical protein RB602_03375 [Parasphingorhabdus sp. SCSIO 66989]
MFAIARHYLCTLFCLAILAFLSPSIAEAQIIYQDDFEDGASGWSNNSTETHPNFSRYLGRFDNSPNQTSRTFTVPDGSQSLVIAFDFYRFDSWDNTSRWGFDRFQIDIDGNQIFSLPLTPNPPSLTGSNGNVSWVFQPVGPYSNQAYGRWQDQRFRVTITIANPPTTVAFTLRTAINQGGNDESGGFDNMLVEAIPFPADVNVTKTSALDPTASYRLPGEAVIYTIEVTSEGGPLDSDTLRITDFLPPEITMFTGNFDGAGNPVSFTDLSSPPSGITCCTSANLSYSDDSTPPLTFNYAPNGGEDPNVTGLEIAPSGQLRQGTTSPVRLRFQLRGVIK